LNRLAHCIGVEDCASFMYRTLWITPDGRLDLEHSIFQVIPIARALVRGTLHGIEDLHYRDARSLESVLQLQVRYFSIQLVAVEFSQDWTESCVRNRGRLFGQDRADLDIFLQQSPLPAIHDRIKERSRHGLLGAGFAAEFYRKLF